MGIHAIFYNEEYDEEFGAHELVDIDYTCSYICMTDVLAKVDKECNDLFMSAKHFEDRGLTVYSNSTTTTAVEYGAWPGGSETDYDVSCAGCKTLLWHGLDCECADKE